MREFTKEAKSQKRIKILYFAVMAIACGNAFVFNSIGYSGSRLVVLLLLGIAMLTDIEKNFYLIAFCFPMSSILKISSTSISILPLLYFIVIIKLALQRKARLNLYSVIALAFFSVWQLFSVLAYGAGITSVVSLLLNVVFVVCSSAYFIEHGEENRQLKTTSIFLMSGTFLDIFLCDVFPSIPYIINYQKQSQLDYNNRYAAMNMDPNEYSQIILVSIGLTVAILPLIKSKIGKVSDIAVIVYFAVKGYRSYSKSYVLSLMLLFFIALVIYILKSAKEKGPIITMLKFVPIVIVGVVGATLLYKYVVVPVFEARSDLQADLLTGRDYIWSEYFKALKRRFDVVVIGCGASNSTFLHKYCSLHGSVAHNLYLEFLIQFGVTGIIALSIAWRDAIKSIVKNKLTNYMVLPLAAFFITSFGISANANDCLYVLMLIMSMPYSVKELKKLR